MGLQDDMVDYTLGVSPYNYSAVSVDTLLSPMYTLATVVVDDSGSVCQFRGQLENLIKEIVQSLLSSPCADYVLVRVVRFGSKMKEIHGFMPLADIKLDTYKGCLGDNGTTYLYGACVNALDATFDFAKNLVDREYKTNALVYVITDGEDTSSHHDNITAQHVKASLGKFVQKEVVESMVSILVGINVASPGLKKLLDEFSAEAGFDRFVPLDDASESTLKKVAGFGSQSIIAQSKSLGSGGKSQLIQSLTI